MSIIKTDFVEIEIQQQTDPDRATHWCTIIKVQPEVKPGVMAGALEIKNIIMTDYDPIVRYTKDLGDKIIENPAYGLSEKEELHRQMRRKEFQNENN
tara:strand:+ start:422 stop:712 length:291 start_codon:yes stop_codon:yes gene_type:complete